MPTGLYYYAVPPSGAGGGAAAGDATGDDATPRSPVTLPPDGVATLEPCCDPRCDPVAAPSPPLASGLDFPGLGPVSLPPRFSLSWMARSANFTNSPLFLLNFVGVVPGAGG